MHLLYVMFLSKLRFDLFIVRNNNSKDDRLKEWPVATVKSYWFKIKRYFLLPRCRMTKIFIRINGIRTILTSSIVFVVQYICLAYSQNYLKVSILESVFSASSIEIRWNTKDCSTTIIMENSGKSEKKCSISKIDPKRLHILSICQITNLINIKHFSDHEIWWLVKTRQERFWSSQHQEIRHVQISHRLLEKLWLLKNVFYYIHFPFCCPCFLLLL